MAIRESSTLPRYIEQATFALFFGSSSLVDSYVEVKYASRFLVVSESAKEKKQLTDFFFTDQAKRDAFTDL